MARFKKTLAAGLREREAVDECRASLKEKFEKKEKETVYIETVPEKIFRIGINVIAYLFLLIGIFSLIMPETREAFIELIINFMEETHSFV